MTHKLYKGDCLKSLKGIATSSINLILTDPPYNTGMVRTKYLGSASYSDEYESSDDWVNQMRPILHECKRVLATDGSFFSFIDYREHLNYWLLLNEVFGEENHMNTLIWHWDYGGRPTKNWARKYNPIMFYVKDPENYVCNLKESDRLDFRQPGRGFGKIPTAVWEYNFGTNSKRERVDYDGQKPVGVLKRIINVHSLKDDKVLDPFAGSGSTGVACDQTSRQAILMERNPDAFPIIEKRLSSILGVLPRLKIIEE